MKEHDYLTAIADGLVAAALLVVAVLAHLWLLILVAIGWAVVGLRHLRIARRARAASRP